MMIPLLALIVSLFPFEQVIAQPEYFSPNPVAQELIDEVNALRATNVLPAYKVDPILMKVAQAHADYLATKGIIRISVRMEPARINAPLLLGSSLLGIFLQAVPLPSIFILLQAYR